MPCIPTFEMTWLQLLLGQLAQKSNSHTGPQTFRLWTAHSAAEKQPRNLGEKVLRTSHKQPLSNAVNKSETAADMQPHNAVGKRPSMASEQPLTE